MSLGRQRRLREGAALFLFLSVPFYLFGEIMDEQFLIGMGIGWALAGVLAAIASCFG